MKIPKEITKELEARGWTISEGETWRAAKGKDWSCAYHYYRKKCCLITVAKCNDDYFIQILYPIPVCSQYVYNKHTGFNVHML